MWLCKDKLKEKTAHFRLPSASQKRACLSSLITIIRCSVKPLAIASWPKSIAHAQTFIQSKTLSKRIIPESLVTRPAGQGERRLWERDWLEPARAFCATVLACGDMHARQSWKTTAHAPDREHKSRKWDTKCQFRSFDLVFCLCHFITLDGVNFGSEIVVI